MKARSAHLRVIFVTMVVLSMIAVGQQPGASQGYGPQQQAQPQYPLREAPAGFDLPGFVQEVCAWFDSLGLPDVSELPMVRYPGGGARGTLEETQHFRCAFVENETEDTLDIVTLEGDRMTIPRLHRTVAGTEREAEEIDVALVIRDMVRGVQQLRLDGVIGGWFTPSENPEENGRTLRQFPMGMQSLMFRMFFLGRAMAGRGDQAAAETCIWAGISPLVTAGLGDATPIQRARDYLSEVFYWRAIRVMVRGHSAWSSAIPLFQRCIDNNGDDAAYRQAVANVAMIQQMAAEDEAHDARVLPPWDAMTPDQKVEELIYRIRFGTGLQRAEEWEARFTPPQENDPVGSALVALGLDAVAGLIEIMDDQRFTPAARFQSNIRASYQAGWDGPMEYEFIRYSAVAMTLLIDITGITPQGMQRLGACREGEGVEHWQGLYRTWLLRARAGQAPQLWESQVRSGLYNPLPAARLLWHYAPERIIPALREGVESGNMRYNPAPMLQFTLEVGTEDAFDLVFARLETTRPTQHFVRFVLDCAEQYPDRCQTLLETRWRRVARPGDGLYRRWLMEEAPHLLHVTLAVGEPPLLAFATDRWWQYGQQYRQVVVGALCEVPDERDWRDVVARLPQLETMERFLVTMAERDRTQWDRHTMWNLPADLPASARLCDLAGVALARYWPERYSFAWSEGVYDRDVQLQVCINTWREAHGMELLPPLPAPPPPPVPEPEEPAEEPVPQSQPQSQPGRR